MKRIFLIQLAIFAACMTTKVLAQTPTPEWRPVYHFTPEKNWTNDPNGLIFLNGKFQLYYQHNPLENKWGHMSWGHAESVDLVHWKYLPVAIPEIVTADTTTYIYSGSAVLDVNNTSGFGKNGKPPVVAIFTGDQPKQKKEAQFIAYSNDNGISYKIYAEDPVIDLNMRDFRDPNVFWYEPKKAWVMTVAMVNEHQIRFYTSKDLKKWDKLSDFGPAGFIKNGWECPSLIPLAVDGDPKNIKYVLFVSLFGDHGPEMQYFIGDFDGTTFKNLNQDAKILRVDFGDSFYAAIAWRNAPQNKKILLGWLINGKPETSPWKGQMSIPRDLSLRKTPDGIRLFQTPSTIITGSLPKYAKGAPLVRHNLIIKDQILLSDASRLNKNAYWIEAELKPGKAARAGFWLTVNKDGSKKVEVGYNTEKQELYVDCTTAERANKDQRNLIQSAPLKLHDGIIKLRILVDKSSLEVFGNGGEQVISTMIYPDHDATGVLLFSSTTTVLKELKVWDMD